jgi:transposase
MEGKFTISQFLRRFPNDEACLEEIKQLRFPAGITCPKCEAITNFYKIKGRTAYSCSLCGTHVFPLAGTIFDKTTTSLRLWFYAIYLMAQTRAGISAKQLQRELGVTYKTAWRMFKQIRMLMDNSKGTPLTGIVEIDETFIGGKGQNKRGRWTQGVEGEQKEVLMGMVERKGKVYLKHVQNTGKWTLLKQIKENVSPEARVITDEFSSYVQLPKYGYAHDFVNHKSTYVVDDIHTNNIENVWSNFKRGVRGVYRNVSKKYLQAYADEYAFRYSNRASGGRMFDLILAQIPTVKMLRA